VGERGEAVGIAAEVVVDDDASRGPLRDLAALGRWRHPGREREGAQGR
jgi:hypothetical protein